MPEQDKFAFTRAVLGASRLVQLDLRGVELFEKTAEAAWRSVRFPLYCVPMILALAWYSPAYEGFAQLTGFSRLEYALLMGELFLITAFGFMLVVYQLGKRLGYNDRFAHYVNTQCSIALPVVMLVVMLTCFWRLIGITNESERFLHLIIYALQIVIEWGITYGTLKVRPLAAFGICVLAVLFGKVVELVVYLIVLISLTPGTGMLTP